MAPKRAVNWVVFFEIPDGKFVWIDKLGRITIGIVIDYHLSSSAVFVE
jgi:hypothetical protein